MGKDYLTGFLNVKCKNNSLGSHPGDAEERTSFFKVTLKGRNDFAKLCAIINISGLQSLILTFVQPTLKENMAQKR